MGSRKVVVKPTAAESISVVAWYIESFGLIDTAEKFADDAKNPNVQLQVINAFLTKRSIPLSL